MIYLCRHGQTEFNLARIFQGRLDSPLTQVGLNQARRVADALRPFVSSDIRVVCSPLGRARHTASLLCESLGLSEPVVDERLSEVSWGAFDGLSYDVAGPYGDRVGPDAWAFHAPDGETFAEVCARVQPWLDEQRDATPVIAISHAGTGRVLRALYLGLDEAGTVTLPAPNDGIFRLCEGRIDQIECSGEIVR